FFFFFFTELVLGAIPASCPEPLAPNVIPVELFFTGILTVWHLNRSGFGGIHCRSQFSMLPIIDWHPASHSGN
ncbi:hypothetical protein, partial [Escherichia coli]|uniref:hypothetical protein n=1 Tax=Escherichia coli TaxID=562 RepID=UPI001BB02460